MKDALIRLGRILVAQAISWSIMEFAGVNVPYINISLGAMISAVAKWARDQYGWFWLPI